MWYPSHMINQCCRSFLNSSHDSISEAFVAVQWKMTPVVFTIRGATIFSLFSIQYTKCPVHVLEFGEPVHREEDSAGKSQFIPVHRQQKKNLCVEKANKFVVPMYRKQSNFMTDQSIVRTTYSHFAFCKPRIYHTGCHRPKRTWFPFHASYNGDVMSWWLGR